ncbi:phage major capsid protein [Mycobacterium riyadhense]|uniref:phage major capsid protein n=1 Tax=Mycobacterium riyadhense TaxID=486698 RepID=UPI001958AA47|nr:phage major capsid protein [Mycobacterium riyadhense]
MSSPLVATTTTEKAWHPDVTVHAPIDVVPDALILQVGTKIAGVTGDEPTVRAPHVSYVGESAFTAEGATIDEAEPDSSETLINTAKVAILTKISIEQYEIGSSAEDLSREVRRALTLKANEAFLSQPAPTPPAVIPCAGILNQNVTDGGVVGDNLDAIVEAIETIETDYGTATHVISSPSAWRYLVELKEATGSNKSLVGAGVEAAERRLLSLPVLVSPSVPINTLAVVDRSAILTAMGNVRMATDASHYFDSESVAIRASFRFGATVSRAQRVVVLGVDGS